MPGLDAEVDQGEERYRAEQEKARNSRRLRFARPPGFAYDMEETDDGGDGGSDIIGTRRSLDAPSCADAPSTTDHDQVEQQAKDGGERAMDLPLDAAADVSRPPGLERCNLWIKQARARIFEANSASTARRSHCTPPVSSGQAQHGALAHSDAQDLPQAVRHHGPAAVSTPAPRAKGCRRSQRMVDDSSRQRARDAFKRKKTGGCDSSMALDLPRPATW